MNQWFNIVKWALFVPDQRREELGVTQANVAVDEVITNPLKSSVLARGTTGRHGREARVPADFGFRIIPGTVA